MGWLPNRLPAVRGLASERCAGLPGPAAVWSRKRNERSQIRY